MRGAGVYYVSWLPRMSAGSPAPLTPISHHTIYIVPNHPGGIGRFAWSEVQLHGHLTGVYRMGHDSHRHTKLAVVNRRMMAGVQSGMGTVHPLTVVTPGTNPGPRICVGQMS